MKKAPATEAAKRQAQRQHTKAQSYEHRGDHKCHSTLDSYAERIEDIRTTLLAAGIELAHPDALGSYLSSAKDRVFRFATAGKPHHRNGWIIAYHDRGLPFVLLAGDWSTGAETKWVAGTADSLSQAEQRKLQRRLKEARQARESERACQWERTAAAAARIWHSCTPAEPNHPYLLGKNIKPFSAREQAGNLVLLLTDFTGKAWSLQTIDAAGNKRLMAGGQKTGHFIVVSGPYYPTRVLICEGFSTGCTLAELDPTALVLAAIDCFNLKTVATGARNRWPNADLIVCGDDDRLTLGNPGATAARAAALAARARLALPEWPPNAPLDLSDFNDLQNWMRGRQ
ncbi:toprim domain-containing protein [Marinobacter sp. F4218]|uniref:toprim domain-containing protein n=1 Tax=Marinobacter sp. F4218 TaxID=2862868 RepID=UPI001C629489|nr:toprim domain-containing protein [Marinobacter sp. F4218]MBW7471151.1 toprim domain-containing protein [Marinobacter sp. F4218]